MKNKVTKTGRESFKVESISRVPEKPIPLQPLDYVRPTGHTNVDFPKGTMIIFCEDPRPASPNMKRTTGLTGRTYLDITQPRISSTALALIVVILGALSLPAMDHVVGLYPHRVFPQVVTDLTFYVLTFICCVLLMRE